MTMCTRFVLDPEARVIRSAPTASWRAGAALRIMIQEKPAETALRMAVKKNSRQRRINGNRELGLHCGKWMWKLLTRRNAERCMPDKVDRRLWRMTCFVVKTRAKIGNGCFFAVHRWNFRVEKSFWGLKYNHKTQVFPTTDVCGCQDDSGKDRLAMF